MTSYFFCWQSGGASRKTFITHTSHSSYFTFSWPLFRWCLSIKAFIVFFPFGAPSSSSKFSPKVSREVCSCYERPCPLGTNFNIFKDRHCYASFSSSGFILAMFRFFDGVPTRNRFGFLKKMFSSTFIHSIHLSIGRPSGMVFEHLWYLFDQEESINDFS